MFLKSVDTFSINEKKIYSRRYCHSLNTSGHLQHGVQYSGKSRLLHFIADDSGWNSDMEVGFGSVGLSLVV